MHRALLLLPLGVALAGGEAAAEIATDGTAGPALELDGPDFPIGEELGTRAGDNLFHSFERFSLRAGESATFSGPDAIRNVVSRVTGGERSKIDGTIASTMPVADFYFINPAGVLFGPNASLNVPGSFHVSTANELRFRGGEVFSASNPAASSFSFAAPEAFGFFGGAAGEIRVAGSQLLLNLGATLSLSGGELTIENGSGVVGSNLLLAAQASAGEVRLDSTAPAAVRSGRIVMGSGQPGERANLLSGGSFGGNLRIEAGELRIINANVSDIHEAPVDSTGRVDVAAERVIMRNENPSNSSGDILTLSGSGRASDVRVVGSEVTVVGGLIGSLSVGGGKGGQTVVEADRILLAGTASLIGGIDAPSDLFPSGASGGATITAHESLTLGARGVISTGSQGESPAGSININLNENAALIMQPGSLIEATASGTGQGGGIAISGGDVTITGGTVSAETFAGGRGGKIEIDTGQMILNNDGEITTKAGSSGGGGRIKVKADVIELRNGGQISAVSTGSGNAGNLRITAQDELVLDRGVISTSALQAGGGRITIQVGKLIDLQKSLIASSVFQDTGNAGDIRIDPDFLVLDDSQILAQAVAGSGGDIRIVADHLVLSPDSLINAEAGEEGVDGTVVTSEPAVDLASALVVLDVPLLDADRLLRERCAARRDVGTSSFIGVGRGGLPASPDQPLGSAYRPPPAPTDAAVRPAASTLALPCSGAF